MILNYQILHFSHRGHYFAYLTLTNLDFLFVELDHWLNDRNCLVSIELDINVLLQSYDDLVINSVNSYICTFCFWDNSFTLNLPLSLQIKSLTKASSMYCCYIASIVLILKQCIHIFLVSKPSCEVVIHLYEEFTKRLHWSTLITHTFEVNFGI